MSDVEISGSLYRIGTMPARQQLHVARRLASLPISAILGATNSSTMSDTVIEKATAAGFDAVAIRDTIPRLLPSLSLRSLGMLSDADCDYVINACMAVCHRRQGSDGVHAWAPVWNAAAGQMMFQDITLETMMELTVAVLQENLGSFFGGSLSASQPVETTGRSLT